MIKFLWFLKPEASPLLYFFHFIKLLVIKTRKLSWSMTRSSHIHIHTYTSHIHITLIAISPYFIIRKQTHMPSLSALLHHITLFILKIQRGNCDQKKALPLRTRYYAWADLSPTYVFCQKLPEQTYTQRFCGPTWQCERPVNYFCWDFCLKANHKQHILLCLDPLPTISTLVLSLGSSSEKIALKITCN